jgi:hypothetical protein
METTMTLTSVLADAKTVLTEFNVYLAMAVAVPLGIALVGIIKRWVSKR